MRKASEVDGVQGPKIQGEPARSFRGGMEMSGVQLLADCDVVDAGKLQVRLAQSARCCPVTW
jgi:hypothetical protein